MSFRQDGNEICVKYEQQKLVVKAIRDDIVNIFVPYRTKEHYSKAIDGDKEVATELTSEKKGEDLVIATDKIRMQFGENLEMVITRPDGTPLVRTHRQGRSVCGEVSEQMKQILESEGHDTSNLGAHDYPVQMMFDLDEGDDFYGLGDKTGFLNKKNYEYENWNSDIPQAHNEDYHALYKSIPVLFCKKKNDVYGMFFDNTFHSYLNLGKENPEYYFYGADDGNLDLYFLGGEKLTDLIEEYTYLTGRTPLPQRWTLGYQQSRWGYQCAEDIRDVAEHFRDLDIPCDAIHFDIDYMDGYRVFTWNDAKYGKPGDLIAEIKKQGFKTVTIIDPGTKVDPDYFMCKEGEENGYFATDTQGTTYVNEVWPGDANYPDFGRRKVRDWWGKHHKFLVDIGVDGVWNDMNEPASFNGPLPDDVQFEYGAHEKVHNIYGHFMAKATYEGLAKNDGGKRPFVLTRAAYAGSQKYCGGWTGDNHSIWAHIALSLEQVCNLSVSGLAMCGSDIGGFGSDTTPELLVRFYEAAVFVPFFRNHSAMGTRRQEPWQFDETTIDAVRKTVKLRYRFIPYIYDLAHECEKTGAPIVRPLVYEYPADKHMRNISDEYMLGSFVLVAPVIAPGKEAREVYLPDGDWYDYYTGEKYSGGRYILADAPLDKVPVFIKAGAIIPVADGEIRSTEDITEDKISILTYPGKGSFVHYQDDNETFAYRDGAYNAVEYTLDGDKLEKKVLHKGL